MFDPLFKIVQPISSVKYMHIMFYYFIYYYLLLLLLYIIYYCSLYCDLEMSLTFFPIDEAPAKDVE